MSTPAPDPYLTAGWTTQHRHRTSAEPPHLEPEPAGRDNQPGTAQPERKPRKHAQTGTGPLP